MATEPFLPPRHRRHHASSPLVHSSEPSVPSFHTETPSGTTQHTITWNSEEVLYWIKWVASLLYNAPMQLFRLVCGLISLTKQLAWLLAIIGGIFCIGVVIWLACWLAPWLAPFVHSAMQVLKVMQWIGTHLGVNGTAQDTSLGFPYQRGASNINDGLQRYIDENSRRIEELVDHTDGFKRYLDENSRRIGELVDHNIEDNRNRATMYKRHEELQSEQMDAVSAMAGKFLLQQRAAEYVQTVRNLIAHVRSSPADASGELDAYLEVLNLGGAAIHEGASSLADTRYTLSHTVRQDPRLAYALQSGALDPGFSEEVLDLTNESRRLHHDALRRLDQANDKIVATNTLLLHEYKAIVQAHWLHWFYWFYWLSGRGAAPAAFVVRKSHLQESIRLLQELGVTGEYVLYEFNDHNYWIAAVANQVRKMQQSGTRNVADTKVLHELLSAKSREMSYYH